MNQQQTETLLRFTGDWPTLPVFALSFFSFWVTHVNSMSHVHGAHLDSRTGIATFINGPAFDERCREDSSRLSRQRASAIQQAAAANDFRGTTRADVSWADYCERAAELGAPTIQLANLGIALNERGQWTSELLEPLIGGAEALPFLDARQGVVYKLFDMRASGGIGKKLFAWKNQMNRWEVGFCDASIHETMEKLIVLHEAHGLPTEVMGLADSGFHLVVKQPLAFHVEIGMKERAQAAGRMGARFLNTAAIRGELRIFWHDGKAWMLGDLHIKNIMQDAAGDMRVMDALIGSVPDEMRRDIPEVAQAILDASTGGRDDSTQLELFS